MADLESAFPNAGCAMYGIAATALNEAVMLVHRNKLTRQQYVMYALADMIAHVEVGSALARKAATAAKNGDTSAEKYRLASKIFVHSVAQIMFQNVMTILMGTGKFDQSQVAEFTAATNLHDLTGSYQNVIDDMDKLGDIIFER